MIKSPECESLSAERKKVRALCPCCGGGEWRKGYMHTKAASRYHSSIARKPRYKDHRV